MYVVRMSGFLELLLELPLEAIVNLRLENCSSLNHAGPARTETNLDP